jgi:hypothetical protein
MKLNKKQVGLIAGVVCVILLIILLLTMCNGGSPAPSQPTDATTVATEEAVPNTEAPEETTVPPTEETTEETTGETEAETEPTTGGNTRPGGTGGPSIGGGGDNTTESDNPVAGSQESPYLEVIPQFPDWVDTVRVAANGSVHYNLSLLDETVARYGESLLTMEGENISVIYNDKTYESVNGLVSVPLIQPKPEEKTEEVPEEGGEETTEDTEVEEEFDDTISIRILNGAGDARILTMRFAAPLGTADNPEEMIRGENGALDFTAAVDADDEDGYFFGFEAERDGTLMLQLKDDGEASYDILVTVGEQQLTLSPDGESQLKVDFPKGESVTVQLLARAAEDGTRPAASANLTGYADYYGTKTNPIVVEKDFTTEEMEPGAVLYYLVQNQKSMALNVEYPAYVIYNGKTHQEKLPEVVPPAEGEEEQPPAEVEIPVVSVKIGNGDEPALMAIGNGGEEAASFDVTFSRPIGHKDNMDTVTIRDDENGIDGINTAVIEEGDQEVYWFTWKNQEDTGIFTVQFLENSGFKYNVIHTSDTKVTNYDDQTADVFELVMNYEDVVQIQILTVDPADPAALPAGSVSFEASFLPHTLIGAEGQSWLTVEGNSLVYCKQGMKYADGAIMTVTAVEADEEGNAKLDENGNVIPLKDSKFTIDYEGVIYTAVDGTIVVKDIKMDSNNPDIFSFSNEEAVTTLYSVVISYPLGHQSNPYIITDGSYTVELYGDAGSGTYYSWTTSEPGTFTFEVDPSSVWSYNISSTRDTTVASSTNNGVATDFAPYVELIIGQGHLNESKDGTVTVSINLGNPSSDAANKSVVSFRVDRYNTLVQNDVTAKVDAGKSRRFMQMLTDTSAVGLTITGDDSFKVVYDGVEHTSENGKVEIRNFSTGRTYFDIINLSGTEQTYSIQCQYPLGSVKNPAVLNTDQQVNIALKNFELDTDYYYVWTAEEDGVFQFDLVGNINTLRWRPWKYEITHGEDVYASQGSQFAAVITQSFTVSKGDKVIIKFGVVALDQATTIPVQVSFTKAEPALVQEILAEIPPEESQNYDTPVTQTEPVAETEPAENTEPAAE